MRTFTRYTLFQVPGWLAAALVLSVLHDWLGLAHWAAWLLFALFVAKDFVLYPLLKRGYEARPIVGLEELIGERGIAIQQLAPRGYVRLRGERWMAESASGSPIAPGARVRVQSADRSTIVVVEDDEATSAASGPPRTQ